MTEGRSEGEYATQEEISGLAAQLAVNRADIDALLARADVANHRAEIAQETAAEHDRRIEDLEAQTAMDRQLITELQLEGLFHKEQAASLEAALRSSRVIGAAMGIVMTSRRVSEAAAFEILRRASQLDNKKLRVIAEEVVQTGDVSYLPWA